MKSDFRVMDALIESLREELSNISESHRKAVVMLAKLNFQYGLLKKEYKQLQEKVDNLETFNMEFEYCPYCDSKIYAHTDYEYCPYCGKKLDDCRADMREDDV